MVLTAEFITLLLTAAAAPEIEPRSAAARECRTLALDIEATRGRG